jgi:hypothetical protein
MFRIVLTLLLAAVVMWTTADAKETDTPTARPAQTSGHASPLAFSTTANR